MHARMHMHADVGRVSSIFVKPRVRAFLRSFLCFVCKGSSGASILLFVPAQAIESHSARVQILIKLYGKFWGTDSHAWVANNDLHTTGFSGKENKTTIMTLLDHDLTGLVIAKRRFKKRY
jgi:hypothetical protein